MITDDTDTTTSADGEAAASTTRKRRQPPKRHLPVVPSIDPRLAGPAPAAPVYPTRFELVLPIAKIRPSPTNPRKRFDQLEDLAASIRQHGLQMPPQVRELPGDDGTDFEIIFGERRWRAAKLAGLTTIPAFVVTGIPDDVVIERQIIENVQRQDVDPLDEAFGFRQLLSAGRDVDYIATKTGKSRSWIYSRLKLAELSEPIRDHIATGKLSPSIALLVARIPDPKMQLQATREVLRISPDDVRDEADAAGKVDDDGAPLFEDEEHMRRLDELDQIAPRVGGGADGPEENAPMTVREATEHIQKHYMTRLEDAPFPIDDESLPGGACTKCIHRTGNQVELFADVKRPDVCTNPPCFTTKKRTAFERDAAAAAEKGAKVLSETEAKKVFHPYHPEQVSSSAPYVELDQQVPWGLLPPAQQSKPPTWGALLGKKAAAVPQAIAQDAAGGRHDLVDKAAAVKLLRETGKLPKAAEKGGARGKGGGSSSNWEAQEEKRRATLAIAERAFEAATTSALGHVRKTDVEKDAGFWRWLLAMVASGHIGERTMRLAGVKSRKELDAAIAKAKTVGELRTFLVLLVLSEAGPGWNGKPAASVLTGLKLFGADFGKAHAGELAKIKAAAKAEAGAAKKKPAAAAKGQAPAAAAKTKKIAKAAPSAKPSKKSAKKAGRK